MHCHLFSCYFLNIYQVLPTSRWPPSGGRVGLQLLTLAAQTKNPNSSICFEKLHALKFDLIVTSYTSSLASPSATIRRIRGATAERNQNLAYLSNYMYTVKLLGL